MQILMRAKKWLEEPFDKETKTELKQLLNSDSAILNDAFYKDLEFGTGGMRGIMGIGTNRINKYTLGKATQGLSNYLKKEYPNQPIKVVIAYDCRNNSQLFANLVSDIFSSNDIRVYLFSKLRPTPELSFAVKELGCNAGIVLTASHNPPEYNGYKVYWADGGQIVPPHDKNIIDEINLLDFKDIKFQPNKSLIELIDKQIDKKFIKASIANATFEPVDKTNFKVVFTPLHGTAIEILPKVLEKAAFTQVHIVKEQATPDGYFLTVKSPNPEEPEALKMALEKAEKINADIVIGTDPDSDRFGIAVRNLEGQMQLLTGNQTMILLTKYLLEKWKSKGKLRGNEFVVSTVVSTPMIKHLSAAYGVDCKVVLTGFKWIAKMINDFPNQRFIAGGEESFGYSVGDFVRDKDAITSSLLACELTNELKQNGSSLFDYLIQCYIDYGFFYEGLFSVTKKGEDGLKQIAKMMESFRNLTFKSIDKSKITWVEDYKISKATNLDNLEEKELLLPKSDVLIFNTEDGTRFSVRPSGTEPKIKFYICVRAQLNAKEDYKAVLEGLKRKIERITKELNIN